MTTVSQEAREAARHRQKLLKAWANRHARLSVILAPKERING